MLKSILRTIVTIVGALLGYCVYLLLGYWLRTAGIVDFDTLHRGLQLGIPIIIVILFALLFFQLTPIFHRNSRKMAHRIESDLQHISVNELVATVAGLVIGLLVAYLISRVYELIHVPYLTVILTIVTYLFFAYLGVIIASRKAKDLVTGLAGSNPLAGIGRAQKQKEAVPKILDTSVIIDGRIADVMKTGFLEGPIIIPQFVLLELQHIADSSDALKRNRGRRGLDILQRIQTEYGIEIYDTTGEKGLDEIPEVDIKLLKLAQNMNGKVVTNDFNLNKVAVLKDVEVLNVNELANTLKPVVLPGESMELFLVKEGKSHGQAVAYLDDGTMIVVEEGRRFIGRTIRVLVTSVLQTAAGRMIFARPAADGGSSDGRSGAEKKQDGKREQHGEGRGRKAGAGSRRAGGRNAAAASRQTEEKKNPPDSRAAR
ncbi:MAG: PIN/TRAM domain-containing protein [Anaerovoracaceae bacterium]|jgi:uncharacterized protein YacL